MDSQSRPDHRELMTFSTVGATGCSDGRPPFASSFALRWCLLASLVLVADMLTAALVWFAVGLFLK
jgi:hypothetical protein